MRRSAAIPTFAVVVVAAMLACQAAPADRDEVLDFVRAYVATASQGDATALMDMMSKNSNVSSVALGHITRGWEAIRADADQMATSEGTFRVSLGTMDVTPLGSANVLVVAPATITFTMRGQSLQLPGAMTLVLERETGDWKVLHEHYSAPIPEN
jgi:ketosteroid isomerase-like protein